MPIIINRPKIPGWQYLHYCGKKNSAIFQNRAGIFLPGEEGGSFQGERYKMRSRDWVHFTNNLKYYYVL